MTIGKEMLQQMPAVGTPQATCLATLFAAILALRGRVNVRHLRRYGDACERTIARQCRRCVDGPDVHHRVITVALDPGSAVLSAPDASCIPQRGQQTFGLAHVGNGCTALVTTSFTLVRSELDRVWKTSA